MKKAIKKQRYIFGKKFQIFQAGADIEYKMPSIARVLDGFNFTLISFRDTQFTNFDWRFDFMVNNEIVIEGGEVGKFALFGFNQSLSVPEPIALYGEEYYPTPRPLSGSDQIRFRFYQDQQPVVDAEQLDIFIAIHYQPKQ